MGDRLGHVVQGLWTHILSALGWLSSLPKRFFVRLGNAVSGFWRRVTATAGSIAAGALNTILGLYRLIRGLLTRLILQPIRWIGRIISRFARWLWAFLGRCGLALRNLLNIFIWQPLLFVSWPLRWLYRKVLYRPLHFAAMSLAAFGQWFLVDLLWAIAKRVLDLVVSGFQLLKRGASAIARPFQPDRRSRLETRLADYGGRQEPRRRRGLSGTMAPVTSHLGLGRVTTAVVTTGILLALGVLTSQTPSAGDVVAGNDFGQASSQLLAPLVPKMTLTPTKMPAMTPEPTARPIATSTPNPALAFWPTPDPLGSGGTLLFTARQQGNADIYAISIGQPDPERLTSHPAADRNPAWSPDGRHIAFSSHRDGNWEIYVLDLPSSRLSRITENLAFDGAPSWSPDSLWLVFESYRNGNMDLFIADASGGDPPIRITEHPAHDYEPAWSPDGRHIAYTSWRSGNQDIFIMSLDTASDANAINITSTPSRHESGATFDSTGSYLAYASDGDGLSLVNVIPLADYQPDGEEMTLGRGRSPSWSADDKNLAYVSLKENHSYIIAASLDRWAVAPQAYATAGLVDDLSWSASYLPQKLKLNIPVALQTAGALFTETVTVQEPPAATFLLREVTVEAPSPYLSDKVDDSFNALRQRTMEEVGWDFLGQVDNMFSFLSKQPYPGEPHESWNKAARAFDFYHRYPMSIDPQVEIVREDRGGETYWRVFLKTAVQDGTRGEPLRQLPWDFTARYAGDPLYYDQGGKLKDEIPAGYYIDFTTLAGDYGWSRTPALANWRTFFQGIRFWHYENRGDLTWEDAILELYTADELDQVYGNQ